MHDSQPIVFTLLNQFVDLIGGCARTLRSEHGIGSILLHTGGLPNPNVYDLKPADFDQTIDYVQELQPRPIDGASGGRAICEAAQAAERRYGCRIVELIRADRHLGPQFANGAAVPTSRYGRRFSYEQAVDLAVRLLAYFDDLIERTSPRVIVTTPGDTARMALISVAERRGIPIRLPSQSYSNDAFQWRVDRYFWPANLARAFEQTANDAKTDAEVDANSDDGARAVPDSNRTAYARRELASGQSILVPMRSSARAIRREVGNVIKRRSVGYGGYRLGETIATTFATWRAKKRLARLAPSGDSLPGGCSYILYPLVVEPETTLQCESPMADNQLTIIDWLAKSIPGGWRLVVKEHPGFTYPRPGYFWQQIRRYPNVVVAALGESGERLAQDARMVAVINGTLGMQAAAGGVPVLTFHPHWWGRFLPHVAFAGSYEETADAIRKLADDANLPPVPERQRLGRALERALDVDAVHLEDPRILNEKALGEPTPEGDVRAILEALFHSLRETDQDRQAPFDERSGNEQPMASPKMPQIA